MIVKYFLSPTGEKVGNPADDHADQARQFLPSKGIVAKDYLDLYTQMFALGYARVSEDFNEFHIERPGSLSPAQKQIVLDKLAGTKDVFINDRRYTESKSRNGVNTIAEQILGL